MSASKNLLPRCPGPKLGPFEFQNPSAPKIQVLEYLGSGLHSEVFKVKIDSKVYALKVFRFYRPTQVITIGMIEQGYADARQVANHKVPFNAECRAYGRLQETGRTDLAIECYGHLHLTKSQEDALKKVCDKTESWDRREDNANKPLQCIVKEYVDSTTFFTRRMFSRMKKDIQDLNQLGILIYDVRKENYLNGKIIDFSQAHTVPHIELEVHPDWNDLWTVENLCQTDYLGFDDMVDEWNSQHPNQLVHHRFFPSVFTYRKLRARPPSDRRRGMVPRSNVAEYNWAGRPPKRKQYQESTKKTKKKAK